ncbi:HNH endonuclease family protein, partial [Escherichia coli]|nr:HNH endonuclease family protein [Escherichia coli]
HSPLYLNIGLGQCEKWDEAAIRARADRLADLAVQVWQAPALSEEVLAVYRAQPENKTSYSLSDYPFLADGSHSRVLFDHLRDEVMRLDA